MEVDISMTSADRDTDIDIELNSISDQGQDSRKGTNWYERKTLVKEVFYVQSFLIFIVVISSIVNIARNISECDKQVWLLMLSSGIAHMLPCPGVGKVGGKDEKSGPLSYSGSSKASSKRVNFGMVWYKRTSQHREIFYVQAVLIFIVVISSICFLSAGVGEKNILIVLLSASFAHFLPGPSFMQSKSVID